MEKIYSKLKPTELLHLINRKEDITFNRQDLSPEEEFLQVACFSIGKEKKPTPHKHIEQIRATNITQESWLVISGSIKITLYDLNDNVLKEKILREGDCLITFRGGHDYIVLEENTKIYEYKTGPYQGKEKDNVPVNNE
jgi:hypothetical protein|tara:strand:+ start:1197 stop:1613 length:417 start_codon:yes stop_codon:yes gene_type:complete